MDHSKKTPSGFPKHLIFCLPLLLAGCGTEEPQHFIEEGKVLFDKGELESARVQFKNALQLDPKLSDAYYHIALLDEKKQDWAGMFGNLREAVLLDPGHLDAQLKLAQIYLLGGQLDKALEYTKTALQLSPENPAALLLDASIQLKQNKPIEALQGVEHVLSIKPYDADAMSLKAGILIAEKRNDEALYALKLGIEQNPVDPDLRLLKIRLDIDSKHFDEAVYDYKSLIVQHPEDMGLRSDLASLLSNLGQAQEAENILLEAIKQYPVEVGLKLKLAELVRRSNVERVEKILQDFIAQSPKETQLKFSLAEYYFARRQLTDAENILKAIAAAEMPSSEGQKAKVKLAEIALLQKDLAKVERLAEEVLTIDSNNSDALLLRGGMRLNKRDADGAIADLRIVLRDRPNSEQAMIMMAQASLLKGENEVAESQWRKVLEINPNNMAAIIPLANEMLKRGDYARAEDLSNKAAKANMDDPAPIEMLIQLKAVRKDWEGAKASLEQLKKIPNAARSVKYWNGFLAAQQGHNHEAIAEYQEVLAEYPDHAQTLAALSQLYETTGRRADLINYLKHLTDKYPGIIQAQDILASAYMAEQRWDEAEKTLRTAGNHAPNDIDLKLKLVSVIERQSWSRAEATLKEFIQAQPDQARLKFRIARHYADLKRYPEAAALLEDVVKADATGKDGLTAQLKLAELAWEQNDSAKAKQQLGEVMKKAPKFFEAVMMRANILMAEKNTQAALADLQTVLENRPDFEPALSMMAQAYQVQGELGKAEEAWANILKIQPGNLVALQSLTSRFMERSDWIQANDIVSKAVKSKPENLQILELSIQLHFAQKDWLGAQEAISAFRQLPKAELAGKMWAAKLALNQGQYELAIQLYKDVLSNNLNVPSALSELAQAHYKTGRQKELMAYLKSFLQKNPGADAASQLLAISYANNKNWPDAEKLLQERLGRNPKDASAYALLARLYADQGKNAEAEELYQEGLAAAGVDNQQLLIERAKYYLYKQDFDKAIGVYEEVVKKFPENDEAANNLADLLVNHQAADKESISQALTLVERFKESANAAVQDTYGWVHLKAGNIENALPALKRAAEAVPQDAAVHYHLGAAYQQHGETESAIVELEQALSLGQQGGFLGIEVAETLLKQLKNPAD